MTISRSSSSRTRAAAPLAAALLAAGAACFVPGCASTGDGASVDAVFDEPLVVLDLPAGGPDGGADAEGTQDSGTAATGEPAEAAARPSPLELLQPADIFVAPLADESGAFEVPLADLREALYRGLPGRDYSPISLAWADERLTARLEDGPLTRTEAGVVVDADAILEVRLLFWDESALETRGVVGARLQAELFDPADPDTLLWGYRIGRVVEVGESAARRATRDVLVERVADELAAEVLALLPERDPRRAPRAE